MMMTTNWLVTMIILMIEMTNMPLTIDDKDDKDDKYASLSDAAMTTSSDAGRVNQLR